MNAQAILIAHLPLLRLERNEDLRLGDGLLTRLPWDQFDELTQRAFSDWKGKYVRTDPVFFWYELEAELPFVKPGGARGMQEVKLPQESWPTLLPDLGLGLLPAFHARLVDPVWAALALAAPAGVLPPPRSSMTFLLPVGESHFEIGGQAISGVRLQGDADMELAFLPDGAHAPVDDATLERARPLVPLARFAFDHPVAGPALRQFLTCGDLTLADPEVLLLAVAALESLLLPDVTVGSGEVFARRLAHLLGADDPSRTRIHEVARGLYRRRTAVLHAEHVEDVEDAVSDLPPAAAPQLLAGAILAVTPALAAGTPIDTLRPSLDASPAAPTAAVEPLDASPVGRRAGHRLGPAEPWESATFSTGADLGSTEGSILSWSPLIGLAHEGEPFGSDALGVGFTSLGADAVVGMEEKDIRRDFIAKVRMGGPLAALATARKHEGPRVTEADVAPLTRRRDLAVVGLRLAGFDGFADPELLGWYVYAGNVRYRRETVLRQSVLLGLDSVEPVSLDEPARDRVRSLWSLLARYDQEARHEEVDQLLDLVRRIHDRRFLPATTRAALAAIAVEAMLGRFRPATATLRLERLVRLLEGVPDETAAWFEVEGRSFRNLIAHGGWEGEAHEGSEIWTRNPAPIRHLVAIARAALLRLLEVWVAADPPVRARYGPARVLVRHLGKQSS